MTIFFFKALHGYSCGCYGAVVIYAGYLSVLGNRAYGGLLETCITDWVREVNLCVCVCVCLDLEWKIIYVGSAESEEYDQTLDSVLVGPVPAGRHMFVFQVRDTLSD